MSVYVMYLHTDWERHWAKITTTKNVEQKHVPCNFIAIVKYLNNSLGTTNINTCIFFKHF